ncbi:MAG: hypothetical protein IKG19_05765, partial [Lachnospiraceae bacterium]|nr:hypothetical protein [Lachnospiraceae bacterium]
EKSDNQYENNIEEILMDKPMTLTELSRAMNYRSIPAKLSRTVRKMSEEARLEKRMDNKLVLKKSREPKIRGQKKSTFPTGNVLLICSNY